MNVNRAETIKAIRELNIPRKMLAGAADLDPKRVSDYTRGNGLTAAQEYRIQETVTDISKVWAAFHPFRVELNSPALLTSGLEIAETIRVNRELRQAQEETEKMLAAM